MLRKVNNIDRISKERNIWGTSQQIGFPADFLMFLFSNIHADSRHIRCIHATYTNELRFNIVSERTRAKTKRLWLQSCILIKVTNW